MNPTHVRPRAGGKGEIGKVEVVREVTRQFVNFLVVVARGLEIADKVNFAYAATASLPTPLILYVLATTPRERVERRWRRQGQVSFS